MILKYGPYSYDTERASMSETKFCAALDPVPAGLRRYRIRGMQAGKRLELRYVLAASQAEAEEAYRDALQLGLETELIVGVTPS